VQPWNGRVFLNPPFGPGVGRWFSKVYREQPSGRTMQAIVLWSRRRRPLQGDADSDSVPGVFSFGEDPVYWSCWG